MIRYVTRNKHFIFAGESFNQHMAAHQLPDGVLVDAVKSLTMPGNGKNAGHIDAYVVDIGRVTGRDGKVTTPLIDLHTPQLFALRKNRTIASRCVLGDGDETTLITMIIKNGKKMREHFFISAWPGTPARPEPLNLQDSNLDYWLEHALYWTKDQYVEAPYTSTWYDVLKDQ